MNKIKNLEALEALRSRLPDCPLRSKGKSKRQGTQQPPQEPLDSEEAKAYGEAFDALLTLWQAVGAMPAFKLGPAVTKAQAAATLRLRPLLNEATKLSRAS
jgi:hypothetical protein